MVTQEVKNCYSLQLLFQNQNTCKTHTNVHTRIVAFVGFLEPGAINIA